MYTYICEYVYPLDSKCSVIKNNQLKRPCGSWRWAASL